MTASDALNASSFDSAGTWDGGLPPAPGNDYFTSTFFMRTPPSTVATTYTFGGDSLTLQAYASPSTRSIIYKGANGDVLIINNFTNAAGSRIDQGSGTAGATIGGNQWTIAGNSTLAADQGGPWTINSPLAGSANFTNLGSGTITYNGNNSAFTGRFILGGTTAKLILNSLSALPGNPAASTPDQFTLGATSLLQDNVGVTYNHANGGITLLGNATLRPNTAGSNTIVAVSITGNFTLTKDGAGTLTLNASNSMNGLSGTAGRLNLGHADAVGIGALTVNTGVILDNTSGSAVMLTNALNVSGDFAFAASNPLTISGVPTFGGLAKTITVSNSPSALTLSGVFSGSGSAVTKAGPGTLVFGGVTTNFTKPVTINAGTLVVATSSGSGTVTVNASGTLAGSGVVGGATTVGGSLTPGTSGAGTLTFGTNLTFSGGSAMFELNTSAASGNDKVIVTNDLSLSSADTIYVDALNDAAAMDTADYVLFQVIGTTTMPAVPALQWVGTPPANYLNYTLALVDNNVVLKYTTATAPTVAATANPSPATRNQAVTITAVVTPGSGSIASVAANLTDIGGSPTAGLVHSNANVYTNTFIVGPAVIPGAKTITVTVTDNTVPTALTGNDIIPVTVIEGNKVWDGGSLADDNWSSNPNWAGDAGPAYAGDSIAFAGVTRLMPNMDTNYSVTGIAFDAGAGGFTIGTANSSVLTLTSTNGIVNGSASAQILNVPLVLGSSQIISNGAAGNLTLAGPISGAAGITKIGIGSVTLTGSNSYTGSLFAKAGAIVIDTGSTNRTTAYNSIGQDGSDNATLTLKGAGGFTTTADFNVGDVGAAAGVLNLQDNAVLDVNALYVGSANGAGSTAMGTVNQSGGTLIQQNAGIGLFTIGGRSADTSSGVGVYNLSGGTVIAASPIRLSGYGSGTINQTGGTIRSASTSGGINLQRFAGPGGTYNLDGGVAEFDNIDASVVSADPTFHSVFNFNGGTLKPTRTRGGWMPSHLSRANIRDGGAIIDTAGFDVSIEQSLQHSDILGDADTDGGLTKLGAGTLTLASSPASYYTGPTRVLGGALAMDPIVLSSSTTLMVSNATLDLSLVSGTSLYAAGVTFNGSAALNLNYGTVYGTLPVSALYLVSGGVTNSGTVTINLSAVGLTPGTNQLIYAANPVPTNGFTLGTLPAGVVAHLANSGTSLDLVVTSTGQQLTWAGHGGDFVTLDSNWNLSSSNWFDGMGSYGLVYKEYGAFGDNVTFDDNGYLATNVNLTANVKPASIVFNSATYAYAIGGAGTIGGPGPLVKTNLGSLFLATSNAYAGGTIIAQGTLAVTNNNALGKATNSVTLSGGTLQLDADITSTRSLSVTADSSLGIATNTTAALSGGISGIAALTKTGAGTLNLSGTNTAGQWNLDDGIVHLTGSLTAAGTGQRVRVGNNGGSGVLNLSAGSVATANWSLVAGSDTATGTINLNGGTLVHQGGLNMYLGSGSSGSTGVLNLNSGTISNLVGGILIGEGGASVGVYNQYSGTGLLGGDLTVGQTAAANQLNILGGTASAANLYVGWGNGTATATVSGGTLSLSGQVVVGRGTSASSTGAGTLTVTNGTLNCEGDLTLGFAGSASEVGTVNVEAGGVINVGSTNKRWLIAKRYDQASSVVNVNGGTINLNANTDLRMSTGNGSGSSTVNLNSGAIVAYTGNQTGSGSTAVVDLNNALTGANDTFNLNGGTLTIGGIVAGNTGGTRVFNFNGGTLKPTVSSVAFFAAGVASAANVQAGGADIDTDGKDITIGQALLAAGGGLTKRGAGTLALTGANTYSGNTTISEGTLELGQSSATLATNSTVSISNGAILKLTVAGVTNAVASLVTNGVAAADGIYGGANSGGFITGAGYLKVGSPVLGPGPTMLTNSYSGGVLSLSWPAGQGWRLQSQTTNLSVGLTTNWVYVTDSSVNGTNITTDTTSGTVFYRLVYP